ncbi:MAG: hypothetical protein WAU69_12000, partial [Solirubrobacteraceae bacterium]
MTVSTSQHAATSTPRPQETDSEPILKIEGLRKHYMERSLADRLLRRAGGGTLALDDVSLSVAPRQALAVVGESG